MFRGIRPDGHGLWQAAGHTVGFFVEYDTGTENLARLVTRLASYDRLAHAGGPAYPVLFWLHSPIRETNLHHALADARTRCPVATAARTAHAAHAAHAAGAAGAAGAADPQHPAPRGPAASVWQPAGGRAGRRVALHELGGDHGPDSPVNPNWAGGHLVLGDPDNLDGPALPAGPR
jgi:hypothetical protein